MLDGKIYIITNQQGCLLIVDTLLYLVVLGLPRLVYGFLVL